MPDFSLHLWLDLYRRVVQLHNIVLCIHDCRISEMVHTTLPYIVPDASITFTSDVKIYWYDSLHELIPHTKASIKQTLGHGSAADRLLLDKT